MSKEKLTIIARKPVTTEGKVLTVGEKVEVFCPEVGAMQSKSIAFVSKNGEVIKDDRNEAEKQGRYEYAERAKRAAKSDAGEAPPRAKKGGKHAAADA